MPCCCPTCSPADAISTPSRRHHGWPSARDRAPMAPHALKTGADRPIRRCDNVRCCATFVASCSTRRGASTQRVVDGGVWAPWHRRRTQLVQPVQLGLGGAFGVCCVGGGDRRRHDDHRCHHHRCGGSPQHCRTRSHRQRFAVDERARRSQRGGDSRCPLHRQRSIRDCCAAAAAGIRCLVVAGAVRQHPLGPLVRASLARLVAAVDPGSVRGCVRTRWVA